MTAPALIPMRTPSQASQAIVRRVRRKGGVVVGFPEASIELHCARASGDDAFTETLESDLSERRMTRGTLIALSFVGSVVVTVVGFHAMKRR